MLFIILVLAFISTAISPGYYSLAMHFIVLSFAVIGSTVRPTVFSNTINIIIIKIPIILTAISEIQSSFPMFLPIKIVSLIPRPIRPYFNAHSFLSIPLSFSNVLRSISMNIFALTFCLVHYPLSFVVITISMD